MNTAKTAGATILSRYSDDDEDAGASNHTGFLYVTELTGAAPSRSAGETGLRAFTGAPAASAGIAWGKLQAGLADIYWEAQASLAAKGVAAAAGGQPALYSFQSVNAFAPIIGGFVAIDAAAADGNGAKLLQSLQAIGLQGGASVGALAGGYLPLDRIDDASALIDLKFARPAYLYSDAGAATNQGDASMRADDLRAAYGVTGAGVTVGIISDSFNALGGYAADIASGDLPPGVTVLEDSGTTDEGRAMAQLIHDVAPGAALAFHTANGGQANFAQGILDLSAISDVIVDDVRYFAEPFFQDGMIARAVDQAVASGDLYFSSAGNYAKRSYESAFRSSGATTTINGITYTLHDFDPGAGIDTQQRASQSGTVSYVLQWDQPFFTHAPASGGSANDLALIFRETTGALIAVADAANVGGDPFEYQGLIGSGSFDISIGLKTGAIPGLIKYVTIGGSFTANDFPTNSATNWGHSNAAGAISVGAAAFYNTPEFGVSPPLPESYSSAGGVPILFDTNGNRLASPVIRDKTEITAPDGVNTTFFGSDIAQDADTQPNFFGTSAAAPNAAALAALLLDYAPGVSPGQIEQALKDSAIDMGAAGFDVVTGYGLIQGPGAAALLPVATAAYLWSLLVNGQVISAFDPAADVLRFDDPAISAAAVQVTPGSTIFSYGGKTVTVQMDFASITGSNVIFDNGSVLRVGDDTTGTANDNAANTLVGGSGNDQLVGLGGDDSFAASAGDDRLDGGAGNDFIDGGQGLDAMSGGAGDDIYVVDAAGDVVVESANEGEDLVQASASYVLSGNIENLTLTGAAPVNGTGNGLDNVLTGNTGNNILDGGGGVDVMKGGAGDDTYIVDQGSVFASGTMLSAQGEPGAYIVQGSLLFTPATGTFTVDASDGTGDGLADTLHLSYLDNAGLSGNWFYLDLSTRQLGRNFEPGYYPDAERAAFASPGHPGLDFYGNGAGSNQVFGSFTINETVFDYTSGIPVLQHFSVDFEHHSESPAAPAVFGTFNYSSHGGVTPEPVIELPNQGTDTVKSSITYTLTANVENLTLSGGAAVSGTGNALNNTLAGNASSNTLLGLGGSDLLLGGAGNDTLRSGSGDDRLEGGPGGDVVDGGDGYDYARYSYAASGVIADLLQPGSNTGDAAGDSYLSIEGIAGSAFNDQLSGDDLANDLAAGNGDDTVMGRGGNDNLQGMGGNDTLIGGAGADRLAGGDGFDYARYTTSPSGIVLNLGAPSQSTGDAAGDSYESIEAFAGSLFNDTLLGDNNGNILLGLDGSDYLQGLGGSDTLQGGNDNDQLDGGAGGDSLDGGAGFDYARYYNSPVGLVVDLAFPAVSNTFEAAGDSYVSIEGVIASRFNDALAGDNNANDLAGGDGDDTIVGRGGNDNLQGLNGNDTLDGGAGADVLKGGAGSDRFHYTNIADGNDTITDFVAGAGHDIVDLKDVLVGYVPGSSTPGNFIQLSASSGGTTIRANADGIGSDFMTMALLQGVTALNLDQMIANGNLVLA